MQANIGYNRVFARIDMDNLRFNLFQMKKRVKPDMKVLAVIKADAYGHGAVEIAKRIGDIADYYGVATIDEAIELRNAGIDTPILIIGYTDSSDYKKLIKYDITQTVYDVEECKKMSDLAVSMGQKVKVHIKVDTGMSRIGFEVSEEGVSKALILKDLEGLDIEGIFTHYAKADETDKTFSMLQKDRFKWFIQQMNEAGVSFKLRHIDNSAGTMDLDDDEFDMVRLGIVTYGLYPSDEVDKSILLKPVMSLISHVIHVKMLDEGVGVGYGGTFVTSRRTKVATVAVGYADGYPRAQSNVGKVIINGQYANVIGRVCMDQLMIDVTDIDDVKVKDEVILVGKCGDKCIGVEEVAAPAASFNYEFVCNIGRRVPRVYHENNQDTICVKYLLANHN
ncbi:MAG: alanine racemase [Lachnospiraceae bacterium]|nr:alanine racemase [Lachnospiraceae bacterium]